MERIKKRALSLLNNFKRLLEWVKQSPRNMAISAVGILVAIAAIVLVIHILPYLFLVGIALWVFWEDIIRLFGRYKPLTLENDGVCFTVTKFMYDTICEDKPLEGIVKTPSKVSRLYDTHNYLGIYNEVPILKLRLVSKNRDTDLDCDYLKDILQNFVDAMITDGHLRGYTWANTADNTIPLIKVATLNYSDLFIHIGILLTNTTESVNAARFSDIPALPPKVDDTDPLFMKDGD